MTGALAPTAPGEWEAEIKTEGVGETFGSLRLKREGKCIRSHFKPAGHDKFCEEGLLSTRA